MEVSEREIRSRSSVRPGFEGTTRARPRADGEVRVARGDLLPAEPDPERGAEPLRVERHRETAVRALRAHEAAQPLRRERRLGVACPDAPGRLEQSLDACGGRLGLLRRHDGTGGDHVELDLCRQEAQATPERAAVDGGSRARLLDAYLVVGDHDLGILRRVAETGVDPVRELGRAHRREPVGQRELGPVTHAESGQHAIRCAGVERSGERLVDQGGRTKLRAARRHRAADGRQRDAARQAAARPRARVRRAQRPRPFLRRRPRRWSCRAGSHRARGSATIPKRRGESGEDADDDGEDHERAAPTPAGPRRGREERPGHELDGTRR